MDLNRLRYVVALVARDCHRRSVRGSVVMRGAGLGVSTVIVPAMR